MVLRSRLHHSDARRSHVAVNSDQKSVRHKLIFSCPGAKKLARSGRMNSKRLILAIFTAFAFLFGSNFLIHGHWLRPDYMATATLWRTEAEMNARFAWMLSGQLLMAAVFVVLWATGFAGRGGVKCACVYGLFMGLFSQATTLITYVVTPLPGEIALKWFFSGLAQAVVLGCISFFIYKPALPPAGQG
jgi:hypothetical protein